MRKALALAAILAAFGATAAQAACSGDHGLTASTTPPVQTAQVPQTPAPKPTTTK